MVVTMSTYKGGSAERAAATVIEVEDEPVGLLEPEIVGYRFIALDPLSPLDGRRFLTPAAAIRAATAPRGRVRRPSWRQAR
jgi:hypothetical protein